MSTTHARQLTRGLSATRGMRMARVAIAAFACSLTGPALAWIYPEHRDISVLAVQGLDPARRADFDRLWQAARAGDEQRLCADSADVTQGVTPSCIDWAGLPAIAGDHSCSAAEMLETVRRSDWILTVADVAAQLKDDLARIPITAKPGPGGAGNDIRTDIQRRLADEGSRAKRSNALRAADTRLQRADPQYASRADTNLAHFMLPRPDTNLDAGAYAAYALRPGVDLNAAGVYARFHLSALQKASRLADERLSPEERRALARAALFDEAFALHFLQDVFAAGHLAGSWGDVSQRKGTHDFYNQNGIEVFTWQRRERTVVLMGDAHMRPEDAALAADSVRKSLSQVIDAASGRTGGYPVVIPESDAVGPDAFNICTNATFPDEGVGKDGNARAYREPLQAVLLDTPVPGLGPGLGSLPRERSEVGVFAGLAGSISGRSVKGGFETSQDDRGFVAGLDLGLRVGVGLEGALGDAGDGLVFLQAGYTSDGASTNKFADTGLGTLGGSVSAAIPARSGLSLRLRMPYYVVPGDLLWLSPIYLYDKERYTRMAVAASGGGLLGLQQPWSTRVGRFQFVLGRELGVTWYGIFNDQQLFAPAATPEGIGAIVKFKSVSFEAPILEYRPYRSFASNQSSAIMFQLFASADVPYGERVVAPIGAPKPNLGTVWSIGLRMVFDWRYYW